MSLLSDLIGKVDDLSTRLGTEFKTYRTFLTGTGTGSFGPLDTTAQDVEGAINELAGTGGGASALADLTDVTITAAATGDILRFNGTDWVDEVGATYFQPRDSDLDAIAALGTTSYGRAFLELANQAALLALVPASSETVSGLVELGSLAEHATGTDALRAATIAGVRQERVALKAEILGAGVPAALDTLDELAAALADDASFAATITTSLAGKQASDTDLTAIAALTSAADKIPYATGAGTWAMTTMTAAARGLVDDATTADMLTTLSAYSKAEVGLAAIVTAADFVATFNTALA